MSQKTESCIICDNYRFWIDLQLVDDKGQPLIGVAYTLSERGTGRTLAGSSDTQGLIHVEGMTARPYTLTLEPQSLADALTTLSPPAAIQGKDKLLKDFCREQGYQFSEHHRAGEFNEELPETVHRMTAGQISRSVHYQQRDEGYQLWFPYDHHRVIAIKRIAEPVFAKSILRGEGNTDAGEDVEVSNYFGSTAVYQVQPKLIPSEQAKPAEFTIASLFGISTAEANPFILISLATIFLQQMAVSGGAVQSQNTWQSSGDSFGDGASSGTPHSLIADSSSTLSALSIVVSMGYAGMFTRTESSDPDDLLTYDDLKEKALAKGTATTRIRMGIDEDGQVVGYHTSTESGQDQVPVRMMELASEAETQKVRSLAVYQSANGLPTAASTAEVYKFVTDEGDDVFISITQNGELVGVQSQIHEGESLIHTGHPPSPPFDIRPHTGGNQIPEPTDITSAGGFPIHEGEPQILINPIPEARDLSDYILITPIPSLPVIYVYMSVNEIKEIYDSIKKSPNYPNGFREVQNGTTKNTVKNKDALDKLREVERGKWSKVYKDGYDSNGNKVSIHYFQSESGKVFNVKVKNGVWSNVK